LCLNCSTGNSSKRGYGRLPHEDPDDNHNTQKAPSQNSTAANSTASTPSDPPVNHLTPDLFDFELTDEFSDDSEYGEYSYMHEKTRLGWHWGLRFEADVFRKGAFLFEFASGVRQVYFPTCLYDLYSSRNERATFRAVVCFSLALFRNLWGCHC